MAAIYIAASKTFIGSMQVYEFNARLCICEAESLTKYKVQIIMQYTLVSIDLLVGLANKLQIIDEISNNCSVDIIRTHKRRRVT
jgi:hypothetical protein